MSRRFTYLLEPPFRPSETKSKTVPAWLTLLLFPFLIPTLLVGAAISIPVTKVSAWRERRREAAFARAMAHAGRVLPLPAFEEALTSGTGTSISETLSIKGPFRVWWSPDDILSASPYPTASGVWYELRGEDRFEPFFRWCFLTYTSPITGSAHLVIVPPADASRIDNLLMSSRHVTTCSSLEAAHL